MGVCVSVRQCVCFEFAEMNWYLINSFTLINLPCAPSLPPLMPQYSEREREDARPLCQSGASQVEL